MAAWPGTLPNGFGGGATRQRQDNTLRTAMDVGPAKARRRATVDTIATSFAILLTTAQKVILDGFYNTDCAKVNTFTWNDFSVTGSPGATFRFMAPPVYRHLGGDRWEAMLELEQMP